MTINEFHFVSTYENINPPNTQEVYKLLANGEFDFVSAYESFMRLYNRKG